MDQGRFKGMLLDLAEGITPEELGQMKYLCSTETPKRRLEQIRETHQLWTLLEESGKLSPDDTIFLEHLLKQGCKNRKDLLKIVHGYKRPGSHTPAGGRKQQLDPESLALECIRAEMDVIVQECGRDWRPLARALGLAEADIDAVVEKHRANLREMTREMLRVWVHQEVVSRGRPPTRTPLVQTLIQALLKCEKRALANKLTDKLK